MKKVARCEQPGCDKKISVDGGGVCVVNEGLDGVR